MKILAIETSSPQGSIALFDKDKLIDERIWTKKILGSNNPSHSELLTESAQQILTSHGLAFKDIELVAVGNGPGSFTGIRVGINFARALGYALNIPCFVLDSLSVVAAGIPVNQVENGQDLIVAISAFRNFFYFAQFAQKKEEWTIVEGPGVKTFDDLTSFRNAPVEIVGDAVESLKAMLTKKSDKFKFSLVKSFTYPLAKSLGIRAFKADSHCNWKQLIPLYIRRSEAEEKFGV